MKTLEDYGIGLSLDEPEKGVLIRGNVGHIEGTRIAMELVKELRAQGIQDTVLIQPHDQGVGMRVNVWRIA
jgi:hypothetical protein